VSLWGSIYRGDEGSYYNVSTIVFKASHAAFLGGKNIMSNILALHEVLHDVKRKGKVGIVLKLNFEKACDKVHWGFLMRCLRLRGFYEKWCRWIENVLHNGTVTVKVNGIVGPYF
jgi:hypothetical protein